MLSPRSILAKLFLAVALSWAAQARAFEGLYSNCTACHSPTVNTCAGCHAHGTHANSSKISINLVASTDKATYAPGENVTVTVTGGYRGGWVRVYLYDQNMAELARSSCPPGGVGGCTTSVLPATLTTPAPTTPGTYAWRASWYGNAFEATSGFTSPACGTPVTPPCFRQDASNAGHGEEIVAVSQFTVAAAATGPAIAVAPTTLAFGDVTVGASKSQTFTISNTGSATLTGSVAVAAGTSSEFAASPTTFSIPAGDQPVTVTATYAPTAVGADSGALAITSDDPTSPALNLTVSGAGVEQPPQGDNDDDGGCSSGRSGGWIAVVALALLAARRMVRVRRTAG